MSTMDDDVFLRDIVVSFLLAGRDTVASALSSFFWPLSQNPAVVESIRKESEHVMGGEREKMVSFEQLREIHYLQAAVHECMRCCIVVTGARVLYLGAFGITISHVSDFVGAEGVVYAVESHSGRDLVNMAKKRINVILIVEVARHIAQSDQNESNDELRLVLELPETDYFFHKKKLLEDMGLNVESPVCIKSSSTNLDQLKDLLNLLIKRARILNLNEIELYFGGDIINLEHFISPRNELEALHSILEAINKSMSSENCTLKNIKEKWQDEIVDRIEEVGNKFREET